MGVQLKVIKTEMVAPKPPCHEHRQPFTNLDLLVPPIDSGFFIHYKKPHDQMDVATMIDVLKTSLSQALGLFYTLAGEIVRNASGEPEVHCNNKGVEFIEAAADVDLKDLNFYNIDENVGGKLMPKRRHGVLVVQATALRCGGLVLACLFDHRVIDGYSINLFTSSWANMALSQPLSLFPNFLRSNLTVRHPCVYTPSVANMYVPLSMYQSLQNVHKNDQYQHSLTNRIYYMEGDQIKRLQSLASENGSQMSKIEAVTSFLWKITGSLLEDSGHLGYKCNVVVPVNGRRWLSEGEGVKKQKLMAARFGNVFSMPFRGMQAKDLKNMPLSSLANEVRNLFESASTKEHFRELIDWVEDQRPNLLISRPLAEKKHTVSIMVSAGVKFLLMGEKDFGWGKPVFMSCHVPDARWDWHVMLIPSLINYNDWIVYMHLPNKFHDYIQTHQKHVIKPLTAHYLNLALNPCVSRI